MNSESPMAREVRSRRRRGSTLLVTLMVTVILSLLGVAFLTMSEQENRIAVNERDAKQAVYMAQVGAKMAVEWFQNPQPNVNTSWQNNGDWLPVRTQPGITFNVISGTRYKGGTTGTGTSNILFEKPYRGSPKDMFRGTEGATTADVVLTDSTTDANNYLFKLNQTLRPTGMFPATSPGVSMASAVGDTRITEIQIYEPPRINNDRYGIATVKATATKFDTSGNPIASRSVYAVLNEIKFPAPKGPVNAKFTATSHGSADIHWGEELAYLNMGTHWGNGAGAMPNGIPWTTRTNALQISDLDANSAVRWKALQGQMIGSADNNVKFQDPWYRARTASEFTEVSSTAGAYQCTDVDGDLPHNLYADKASWIYNCDTGGLVTAPTTGQTVTDARHPFPWVWNAADATDAAKITRLQGRISDKTYTSNMSRWDSQVDIPTIQYDVWKKVALGRGKNIHYFILDSGQSDSWRADGTGTAQTMLDWTNIKDPAASKIIPGKAGINFFDTVTKTNPQPPNMSSCPLGDFVCRQLTPALAYQGNQNKIMGGFVYANAQGLVVKDLIPNSTKIPVPGPGETKDMAWKDVSPHYNAAGVHWFWVYSPCKNGKTESKNLIYTGAAITSTNTEPCSSNMVQDGQPIPDRTGVTFDVPDGDFGTIDLMSGTGIWQFYDMVTHTVMDASQIADYDPNIDPAKPFVNFDYNPTGTLTDMTGDSNSDCCLKSSQNTNAMKFGGDPTHAGMTWGVDINGPDFLMDMSVYGIVFNEGNWTGMNGAVKVFGALIIYGQFGVGGTVDIFFDERIIKEQWPPADWKLPRVKVASWKSE